MLAAISPLQGVIFGGSARLDIPAPRRAPAPPVRKTAFVPRAAAAAWLCSPCCRRSSSSPLRTLLRVTAAAVRGQRDNCDVSAAPAALMASSGATSARPSLTPPSPLPLPLRIWRMVCRQRPAPDVAPPLLPLVLLRCRPPAAAPGTGRPSRRIWCMPVSMPSTSGLARPKLQRVLQISRASGVFPLCKCQRKP